METTQHPVVFIHGMLGWGKKAPLWNLGPSYWPEKVLAKINPNFHMVEVGAMSSDHDRACEAFFQLIGGRVDYGLQHSIENLHDQFGKTYNEPLHPRWNESNPVHLIGHSYGATTAIEIYQLICQDAFGIGTNHRWVKSIVCIAGPLCGSTLSYSLGLTLDHNVVHGSIGHIIGVVLGIFWKLQQTFPVLTNLYDFKMVQWEKFNKWSEVVSIDHPINTTQDSVFHCLAPTRRMERNSTLQDMDKVHLLSIVCKAKNKFPRREMFKLGIFGILLLHVSFKKLTTKVKNCFKHESLFSKFFGLTNRFRFIFGFFIYSFYQFVRKLDLANFPTLAFLVHVLQKNVKTLPKLYDGYDHKMWISNDGLVNTYSMLYPRLTEKQLTKHNNVTNLPSIASVQESHTSTPSKVPSMTCLSSLLSASPSTGSLQSLSSKNLMNKLKLSEELLSRCSSHQSLDWEQQQSSQDPSENQDLFQKGRWYIYRVEKNHFCGTFWDNEARELYLRLFRFMNKVS